MSRQLLKRLDQFKKKEKLSILALCRKIDINTVNYYRWIKAQKITGGYKRIIEDFLEKQNISKPALNNFSSLNSDIAVIGIACCYPGASNLKELWENILARRIQFRRMLDQRMPLSEYYDQDPKAPEKTYLTKAAFLENFVFNWEKLRIPKKTVESTDIAHWVALDTALKTFENAGYLLNEIPLQNTGVIVGNTLTGEQMRSQSLRCRWPFVQKVFNTTAAHLGIRMEDRSRVNLEMEQIYKSAFYPVTEDSLAGGLSNTIAGRICNYLNLKGGGYIVDGACSSSLLAVSTAADALKMGNMDLALAGGVDISLDPFELVGFAKAGALARDKMSVYDQSANGFLPGEGCGFVLLKRLNDALRDKNYIYAVIKGWGISSDGKGGIMEPSVSGQSLAMARAYKDLEYKISNVDFVEGHGTGTARGDKVELEGIAAAFNQSLSKKHKSNHCCGVTSFKSIVGHTKAAAGVGGLIKAVLAVNQRILPPTASCITPNEVFKDKAKNLYPLIQGQVLSPTKITRAGISSAGFGGINCHMTVESKDNPKSELKPKIDERALFVSQQQTEIFVFSSRSVFYLKKIILKFKEDLRNISIAEMADLASLLNKRAGKRLPIKAAIIADSPEHLYEALVLIEREIDAVKLNEGQIRHIPIKDPNTYIILSNAAKKNRIGYLYPGQGSQRLNMTRVLIERYSWARDFLSISKIPLYGYIYRANDKFITREELQELEKQLTDTKIAQPAIIISSLIWTEFFSKLGIEPKSVTGHSLGELISFYKAGAFNKETLIKFAELRGVLMAQKGPTSGNMAALICSKTKAQELISRISGKIVIANINSPNQIVISGGKKEIGKALELAAKKGVSARLLNVSNAFHSSFMKKASDKIRISKFLPDIFLPNSIDVYSSMEGTLLDKKINLKEYFSRQMISPVNFVGVIEAISKECDILIEMGPGKVLTDLARTINKENGPLCLAVESTFQNDRDLNIILAELFIRNVPIQWDQLYQNRLIRVFVPTSKKKFIENQCERPLKLGNQVLKSESAHTLSQDIGQVQSFEEIIPGGLQAIEGKDSIADLLVDLTFKLTGFNKESISLESRLLDDLNLDSIKAAELIGQAARTLGLAGQLDPSKLSNSTLEDIRNHLFELVQIKSATSDQGNRDNVFKRYHNRTWVRNFIPVFKNEEILAKNVNQFKDLKNIVILSGKSEDTFSNTIAQEFSKVKIKRIHFDEKPKVSPIDCLIVVLPKGREYKEFNPEALKEILTRAHQMVSVATSVKLNRDPFIVLVGFGCGTFGENKDLKNIASCCMKSMVSTLYLEYPNLRVRILDFDAASLDEQVSARIIDELQTYDRFNVVGYDSQLARRVVYYENSQPASYIKRGVVWSPNDVVLVTGGAKGISAQCALEFARNTKAQMVLVGRSLVPVKTDENNEIVQTLEKFKSEGLKANYYKCDVTNQKEVIAVVKEIERKVGRITGFIHGAGLNSLKRLKQSSVEEAYQESLPKVMGAVNICNCLNGGLKLIAGITSIIGITGMEASGWYGLANEVLNLYLYQYKNRFPKTDVVTIAYSVWDEIGMGARLGSIDKLAEKGIAAIPVKEGVSRFIHLVKNAPGHVQQVIVTARIAGIDIWKPSVYNTNGFRFIEKIEYFQPGVELIAKAQLNVKDDPYLLDHNWKGSLLFPFVFGLEAMAQAVACVSGVDKFDYLKVKNIRLVRPITVPQETGTSIEVHAEFLENKGALQEVKVEIYSQESAYTEPHFSAVFEINASPAISQSDHLSPKPKGTIDLDMLTDIYGPVLFQGELFQRIERIHELYYDEDAGKGECVFTSAENKALDDFFKKIKKFNGRFLIGDPFFIDSILQSMQIIITPRMALPVYIEEISLPQISRNGKKDRIIKSLAHKTEEKMFRGDVNVYEDGKSILNIKNAQMKVLEILPENPSANDLVDPTHRDQAIIENKINELGQQMGFNIPIIRYLCDSRLKISSKEERHQIEVPLIQSTVCDLLRKENKNFNPIKVGWLKSGRLVLLDKELEHIKISLSHCDSSLVCISGYSKQGCDLENIVKRSEEDWLALLGRSKFSLQRSLIDLGFELDFSGTVIWSAFETFKKILDKPDPVFELSDTYKNYVIFSSDQVRVCCMPVELTLGDAKVFSCSMNVVDEFVKNEPEIDNKILRQFGFNENQLFGVHADYSGPQKQIVFTQRFPVTFKTNQMLSRRVYFTNFFDWIGTIRENSVYPTFKELVKLAESGEWGLVTNMAELKILGGIKSGDIVEAKIWGGDLEGDKNATTPMSFEWFRITDAGKRERVAVAEQKSTWVNISKDHSVVIEKMPKFLDHYLDLVSPKTNEIAPREICPEPYGNINLGNKIKSYNSGIVHEFKLDERFFSTTLENSNIVGNIYFANYPRWLGATADAFFYKLIPEYFINVADKNEIICLECNIYYLNDAFPFEDILVEMYLDEIFEKGLMLYFEFYRIKEGKKQKKLAYAKQKIVFAHWSNEIVPDAVEIPDGVSSFINNKEQIEPI